MAVTQADFNRIWASTSPLTPYNFSNTNYLQGWNFVGSTPPSRQMWDFLQKRNDEKAQWLYNNKLPLSGGTMTGIISSNTSSNVDATGTTRYEEVLSAGKDKNNSDLGSEFYSAYNVEVFHGIRTRNPNVTGGNWSDIRIHVNTDKKRWISAVWHSDLTDGTQDNSSHIPTTAFIHGNYLSLAGGTLTGVVNGVTPPNGDNSKKLATTEFVNAKAGNYLPLSGGTMTGKLVIGSSTGQGHMGSSGDYFRISATKFFYGDKPGAGLVLRGRTATTDAGVFSLEAQSDGGSKTLVGKPDGTLTWDGQPLLPVGVVQAFAGSTIPTGWLLCDGSAVSRTTYAALYSVIGTTYGSGNGSTTFNLPNTVQPPALTMRYIIKY